MTRTDTTIKPQARVAQAGRGAALCATDLFNMRKVAMAISNGRTQD